MFEPQKRSYVMDDFIYCTCTIPLFIPFVCYDPQLFFKKIMKLSRDLLKLFFFFFLFTFMVWNVQTSLITHSVQCPILFVSYNPEGFYTTPSNLVCTISECLMWFVREVFLSYISTKQNILGKKFLSISVISR
jgi:hypothetical protein